MPDDPKWLELEGIASVLMDGTYKCSKEQLATDGQPSAIFLEKESGRIARCYDVLDECLSGQPAHLNNATIAAIAALGYAGWRGADDSWRDGLAASFDAMTQHSDLADTAPIF